MKKYIGILFIAALSLNLFSQEVATETEDQTSGLVSKKGIAILPEKGEFSLGVDASPFLTYLGGFLSTNGEDSPNMYTPEEQYNYGISGKYMISDNTAIRANLYTRFGKFRQIYSVRKSELTPDELAPQFVEDQSIYIDKSIVLSAGIEKRRGKSRVQGIYGAELVIGVESDNTNYLYGNSITADFNTPEIAINSYGGNGERLIDASNSAYVTIGAQGFVGVEYFIGPKLSIGGEFSYAVGYQSQGNNQSTYEYWNTTTLSVDQIVYDADYKGYKAFGLTTNTGATLKLNFFF